MLWAECAGEFLVTLDELGACRIWSIKYPDQCEHTLPEIVNLGIPVCVGRLGPFGSGAVAPRGDDDVVDDDDDGKGKLVCITTHFPHDDSRLESDLPYKNSHEPSHVCVTDLISGKRLACFMIAREASGVETGTVEVLVVLAHSFHNFCSFFIYLL